MCSGEHVQGTKVSLNYLRCNGSWVINNIITKNIIFSKLLVKIYTSITNVEMISLFYVLSSTAYCCSKEID